jgi:hypothetical protein
MPNAKIPACFERPPNKHVEEPKEPSPSFLGPHLRKGCRIHSGQGHVGAQAVDN